MTKVFAEDLFDDIVGKQFENTAEIKTYIRDFTGYTLSDLYIGEFGNLCDTEEQDTDDYMNCTFGVDAIDGTEYGDFTLFGTKTNGGKIYITEACWSY